MYWLQCSAVTLDHLYLLTYVLVQFKGGFDDAVRAICIQTFHVKWPFPSMYGAIYNTVCLKKSTLPVVIFWLKELEFARDHVLIKKILKKQDEKISKMLSVIFYMFIF